MDEIIQMHNRHSFDQLSYNLWNLVIMIMRHILALVHSPISLDQIGYSAVWDILHLNDTEFLTLVELIKFHNVFSLVTFIFIVPALSWCIVSKVILVCFSR